MEPNEFFEIVTSYEEGHYTYVLNRCYKLGIGAKELIEAQQKAETFEWEYYDEYSNSFVTVFPFDDSLHLVDLVESLTKLKHEKELLEMVKFPFDICKDTQIKISKEDRKRMMDMCMQDAEVKQLLEQKLTKLINETDL